MADDRRWLPPTDRPHDAPAEDAPERLWSSPERRAAEPEPPAPEPEAPAPAGWGAPAEPPAPEPPAPEPTEERWVPPSRLRRQQEEALRAAEEARRAAGAPEGGSAHAAPEEEQGRWAPPADPHPQAPPPAWGPPPQNQPPPAWSAASAQPRANPYQKPSNAKGIASIVLGVVGLTFCPLLASIAALALGYMGKSEAEQQGNPEGSGRGLAIAGIVIGWIGLVGTLLVILGLVTGVVTWEELTGESWEEFWDDTGAVLAR